MSTTKTVTTKLCAAIEGLRAHMPADAHMIVLVVCDGRAEIGVTNAGQWVGNPRRFRFDQHAKGRWVELV